MILLTSLVGALGYSAAGCSTGSGGITLSPADQAKAKENAKKRFDNFGEQPNRKPSR
jgi:hypothetical protein